MLSASSHIMYFNLPILVAFLGVDILNLILLGGVELILKTAFVLKGILTSITVCTDDIVLLTPITDGEGIQNEQDVLEVYKPAIF